MGIYNTDLSQLPSGERVVFNTLEQQLQNERDLRSRARVTPLQGFHFKEAEIPADLNLDQSANLSSYELIKTLIKQCHTNADLKDIENTINILKVDSLAKIISDERDSIIGELFRNKQFLTTLRIAISSIHPLQYETQVYLNSMILQEHILKAVPELDGLIKGLAQEVNKDCIARVTAINNKTKTLHKMDPDTIIWMVVNRFSSFDISDEKNIKRLNHSILASNQDDKVFTVETLIEIYCTLFDRLGSLFYATWFDITGNDDPTCQGKILNQSYALLRILESQSQDLIFTVLKNSKDRYYRESEFGYIGMRMSFESIPREFVHIWSVLPYI